MSLAQRTVQENGRIGENLRKIRKSKGVSQETVAAHFGITFQQWQKYENGKNRIAAGTLMIAATYFDTPIQDFFA